jgi:acetyl-CoA acetyltransferase
VVFYFAMDGGSRQGGPYGNHNRYGAKLHFEKPYGFTGQPVYFATWARRYLAQFPGSETALAAIALSASENAATTGRAQRPKLLTEAEYWNAPMIADPLRLRDCCVISDGAGAYVMTSRERARDCRKRPVHVLASVLEAPAVSGDAAFTQFGDLLTMPGAAEASQRAFAMAGLRHDDISVAQIYDCFTISCLLQLEDLGFCGKGEGADFVRDGRIKRSGALPINTHGGFLAYSYLLGVEHVVEAVRQLRGEADAGQVPDPRVALVSGLSMPDYGVLLLGAD